MSERAAVLLVPGFTGSGPRHWQSLWAADDPHIHLLQQTDWDRPDRVEWNRTLVDAAGALHGPLVLVGHSLGCVTIVDCAEPLADQVVGAMLVAPSDTESPDAPSELRVYAPLPGDPLPFPSLLVSSDDDPYLSPARARELAQRWRARIISVGRCGHLNSASGHGPWPAGRTILEDFLTELSVE